MAPPADGPLEAGDVVRVAGMPEDANLNGTVGTLVKPVGRARWSLKVEGEEKSRVVPTINLQKCAGRGAPSAPKRRFSIVGTWNDWEPVEMPWSASADSYEYTATIGPDGSESFKILLGFDWDGCVVYPDRKDATLHDGHKVLGPDDGGKNEEWTIGAHPSDEAAKGARFRVRLRVRADGKPTSVGWERLPEEPGAAEASKARQRPRWDSKMGNQGERPAAPSQQQKAPAESRLQPVAEPPAKPSPAPQRSEDFAYTPGQVEDVVEIERQARERLARRLAEAAEQEVLAIEDENPDTINFAESRVRENCDRQTQVQTNLERYRKAMEQNKPKPKQDDEVAAAMRTAVRTCVYCGKMTAAFLGNGCCDPCWALLERVRAEGADAVITKDMPAGLRSFLRRTRGQPEALEAALAA